MGKYMRKGKRVGEVAVEITHASVGVRTRARTLALEQGRKLSVAMSDSMKLQLSPQIDYCHLELRNRKLEKVGRCISRVVSNENFDSQKRSVANSHSPSTTVEGYRSKIYEDAHKNLSWKNEGAKEFETSSEGVDCSANLPARGSFSTGVVRHTSLAMDVGVVSVGKVMLRSSSFSSHVQSRLQIRRSFDLRDESRPVLQPLQGNIESACGEDANPEFEMEASFGDNAMDYERLSAYDNASQPEAGQLRNLREGTPTSNFSRMEAEVEAPGSSSRVRANHAFSVAALRSLNDGLLVPASHEIEEFFSLAEEQQLQKSLSERYNFDFSNDVPLEGRFEWCNMNHS